MAGGFLGSNFGMQARGLIRAELDARELKARFAEFLKTTKARDIPRLLKVSARRVTYRAMELTPPFKGKSSGGGSAIGDWGQQFRQGEISLARDLRKLFFVMNKEGLALGRSNIRKAGKVINGGGTHIPLFASNGGQVFAAYAGLFKPQATLAEMEAFHRKYRSNRGRAYSIKSVKSGNVTLIGKMVVGRSAFARYLRFMRGRLGFAKAGWGRAWLLYKGAMERDNKRISPPPQWIKRHFGKSPGNAIARLTGDNQFIEIINAVRYIRPEDRVRIQNGAVRYESATLARQTKAYLVRKLQQKTNRQSARLSELVMDI